MQGANLVPRQGRAPPPPRKQPGGGEERAVSPPRGGGDQSDNSGTKTPSKPPTPAGSRSPAAARPGASGGAPQFQPPKPGFRPRTNTPPGTTLDSPSPAKKAPGPPGPPSSSPKPTLNRVVSQPEIPSAQSKSPRPGPRPPGALPSSSSSPSASKSVAASAPPPRPSPLGGGGGGGGGHDASGESDNDSPAQFRLPPGGPKPPGGGAPVKSPSAKFAPPKSASGGGGSGAKPPPKPAGLHLSPAASSHDEDNDHSNNNNNNSSTPPEENNRRRLPVIVSGGSTSMARRGSTGLHLNRRESEMLAELAPPSPTPASKPLPFTPPGTSSKPVSGSGKMPPPRPGAGAGGAKPPSSPNTNGGALGGSSGSFKKPPARPSPALSPSTFSGGGGGGGDEDKSSEEESAPAPATISPSFGSSKFPPPRPNGGSTRPTTATNPSPPPPRSSSPGHIRNGGPSGSAPFSPGRPSPPEGRRMPLKTGRGSITGNNNNNTVRSPNNNNNNNNSNNHAAEDNNNAEEDNQHQNSNSANEDAENGGGEGGGMGGGDEHESHAHNNEASEEDGDRKSPAGPSAINKPPPRVQVGPPTPARPSATSTSSNAPTYARSRAIHGSMSSPPMPNSGSGSPMGSVSGAAGSPIGSPMASPSGSSRALLQMPNVHTLSTAQEAAEAFAETESVYVHQGLKLLCQDFIGGLKNNANSDLKKLLTSPELIQAQFELNASAIFDFNTKLDAELTSLRQQGTLLEQLGKTMSRYIPFFKMYAAYIMNFRTVSKFFKDLVKNNKKFSQFVSVVEKSTNSNLDSLISAPTSRLPQYLVFLGAIHGKSPEDASHAEELAKALTSIKTVTDDISVSMRDKSGRDLVVTAQQKWFKNSIDLISPHRLVVKHGPLKLVETTGKFKTKLDKNLFVLCNDCLLYGSKAGRLTGGTVRYVMRLKGGSVREIPDTPSVDYKHAFVIVFASADHSKQPVVACAASPEERAKWMKAITQAIEDDKDKIGAEMDDDTFATIILKKPVKSLPKSPSNMDGGSDKMSPTAASAMVMSSAGSAPGGGGGATGSPPSTKRCKWKKIKDPESGDFYYEHIETYESTWEQPADYFEEEKRGPPPRSAGGGVAVPSPPEAPSAPEAPAAPDAPAAPSAPSAPSAPDAPDFDEQFAANPRFTVAPPTSPRKKGGLLDEIKSGAPLKAAGDRALPPPKPEPKKAANLQDALKSSLDQYRKFVQDEEEEEDEDDWT